MDEMREVLDIEEKDLDSRNVSPLIVRIFRKY